MAADFDAPRRPTAELDSGGGDDLDGLVRRGAARVTPLVEDEAILGTSPAPSTSVELAGVAMRG